MAVIYSRKHFYKDITIISMIILLPLVTYLYFLFPNDKILHTPLEPIKSGYYGDISVLVWVLCLKLICIFSYGVWFITCKHWWRYVLLVPMVFFVFQLVVILNDDLSNMDQPEFVTSIIASVPLVSVLLLVSKKFNYYSASKKLTEELDFEINSLLEEVSSFNVQNFKSVKEQLKVLRKEKHTMGSQDYLNRLIALRDGLTKL